MYDILNFPLATMLQINMTLTNIAAHLLNTYMYIPSVVKTKIQLDPELEGLSLREATQKIVEEEGPGELLVGLGPTVIGYGIEGALKFGLYESLKPFLSAYSQPMWIPRNHI